MISLMARPGVQIGRIVEPSVPCDSHAALVDVVTGELAAPPTRECNQPATIDLITSCGTALHRCDMHFAKIAQEIEDYGPAPCRTHDLQHKVTIVVAVRRVGR